MTIGMIDPFLPSIECQAEIQEIAHQYLEDFGERGHLIVKAREGLPSKVVKRPPFMGRHPGDKILNTRLLIRTRIMAGLTPFRMFLRFLLDPEVAAVAQPGAVTAVLKPYQVD